MARCVILTSQSCGNCAKIKSMLTLAGHEIVEYDSATFLRGDYGLPSEPDDVRLDLMVGLMLQNTRLPVVLVDGKLTDMTWVLDTKCKTGVCLAK